MNKHVEAAQRALKAHSNLDGQPQVRDLRDLLRDLMHWCHQDPEIDFHAQVERAYEDYQDDCEEST